MDQILVARRTRGLFAGCLIATLLSGCAPNGRRSESTPIAGGVSELTGVIEVDVGSPGCDTFERFSVTAACMTTARVKGTLEEVTRVSPHEAPRAHVNRQGSMAIVESYRPDHRYILEVADYESDAIVALPGGEHLVYDPPIRWNDRGTEIAVACNRNYESHAVRYMISVLDLAARKVVITTDFSQIGQYVADLAWSPASDRLAIVTASERTGTSPTDAIGAAIGHPVGYCDFWLRVTDKTGRTILSLPLTSNLRAGFARVSWRGE